MSSDEPGTSVPNRPPKNTSRLLRAHGRAPPTSADELRCDALYSYGSLYSHSLHISMALTQAPAPPPRKPTPRSEPNTISAMRSMQTRHTPHAQATATTTQPATAQAGTPPGAHSPSTRASPTEHRNFVTHTHSRPTGRIDTSGHQAPILAASSLTTLRIYTEKRRGRGGTRGVAEGGKES